MTLSSDAKSRVLDEFKFIYSTGNLNPIKEDFSESEESSSEDAADKFSKKALDQVNPLVQHYLSDINNLLQNFNNFSEAQEYLITHLYKDLDKDSFSEVMTQALVSANLAARYEVIQEGSAPKGATGRPMQMNPKGEK